MKVDVYFNLHKKCLSIKKTHGRVIQHAQEVELKNVRFIVSQSGRERVLREKRKNVHAVVRGELIWSSENIDKASTEYKDVVTYNPYKYSSFVMAQDESPVYNSVKVLIQGRKIYI